MSDCVVAVHATRRQSPLGHWVGVLHDVFPVGLNGRKVTPGRAFHTFSAQRSQELDAGMVKRIQMILKMRLVVSFAVQMV